MRKWQKNKNQNRKKKIHGEATVHSPCVLDYLLII
jgi:hypothetical protein